MILGRIARASCDPSGKGGRLAQRLQLCVRIDEDVLRDVIGVCRRKEREEDGVNDRDIFGVELLELRDVARLRGANEICVGSNRHQR